MQCWLIELRLHTQSISSSSSSIKLKQAAACLENRVGIDLDPSPAHRIRVALSRHDRDQLPFAQIAAKKDETVRKRLLWQLGRESCPDLNRMHCGAFLYAR